MEGIISRFFGFFKLWTPGLELKITRKFVLDFFIFIIVFLLIITAFILGRLSKIFQETPIFSFESKEQEEEFFTREKNELFGKYSTSTIVASSGGKKYYFVWCKGSENIREKNRVYFTDEVSAQKAGYKLASNCK